MQIEEVCQKFMSEFSVIKTEISHIKDSVGALTEEMRDLKNQRYENGIDKGTLKNKVEYLETSVEKHIENHINRDNTTSQRNWGLWLLIIGSVVAGLIGWGFAVLKG